MNTNKENKLVLKNADYISATRFVRTNMDNLLNGKHLYIYIGEKSRIHVSAEEKFSHIDFVADTEILSDINFKIVNRRSTVHKDQVEKMIGITVLHIEEEYN